MRFLFHHRIASRDGQSVHMEELVAALRAQGHTVRVIGPAQGTDTPFGSDGGWVDRLKRALPPALYEVLELGYNLVAGIRLLRAVLQERPDVIYERYNLYTPVGVWLGRLLKLPVLLEVNAPLAEERARHGTLALPALARWTERVTWRGAGHVLPVTAVLGRQVEEAGVPADRITVIANGADPDRFDGLDREEAKAVLGLQGRLVLGFTGFLRAWHGLDRVIALVGDLRPTLPVHLLVLGDGPARVQLEQSAADRGVSDHISILGLVGREQVPLYLAACDIALQPDATAYASPLKLFEYMAAGLAVLAPDRPNLREVLAPEVNALLVPPGDDGAFRAALERLCTDAELRRMLGKTARLSITACGLTWAANARRVAALAEHLANSAGAAGPVSLLGAEP